MKPNHEEGINAMRLRRWFGYLAGIVLSGHAVTAMAQHEDYSAKFESDALPRDANLVERVMPESAVTLVPTVDTTETALAALTDTITAFAHDYTAAWNSGDAWQVAGFFEPDGSLQVNDGAPAVGRPEVAGVAQSFMSSFPDLALTFDGIEFADGRVNYHWTFRGTHSGPGGTGNAVDFSGYESWVFGANGLIDESLGHFDVETYERQLRSGVEAMRTQ